MTDRELIEQFLEGDSNSFHELMSRYQRPLYYTVKSVVLNSEDAKDITQDAFIRAFNNLGKLKQKDKFKSWLFKIAMNLAKDFLRKKKEKVELGTWIPDERATVEPNITGKELAVKIKELLKSLAPKQRLVLGLYLFKEMKPKEIASVLDMKHETVRANIHFGIKNLRKLVANKGMV